MKSKIKDLFDFPQRLWAGKNTKIQGYGDKKAISGVATNGVNGVYTLGKSQSSGPIPDLAKSEEATEFRAGQGVRLYGYGGVYTLERLPDEEEIPAVNPEAILELELEVIKGTSRICATVFVDETHFPDVFTTAIKTTATYENGTIVYNTRYSGDVESWGGDEPEPDACPAPQVTDNANPDFEYGSLEGETLELTTVPLSSLYSPAQFAMTLSETQSVGQTIQYFKSEWERISNLITPSFVMPNARYALGYDSLYPTGYAYIQQIRYRFHNRGNVVLRVNHGFHNYNNDGPTQNELFDTSIYPNIPSAWFDSGIPESDIENAVQKLPNVDRVRIGPYVNIS